LPYPKDALMMAFTKNSNGPEPTRLRPIYATLPRGASIISGF
jgi:hypothetical protein